MARNGDTVIGRFTGKCCDAEVVNNNGMFLGTDLFKTLMDSEEYKTAIENGYYIGFLGHPEDPNDMNFKNACIVMTDMELRDNGDVIGEFDLIDTPVGRVVKSFIDAGVKFGISIRGAGDVANDGTVDPESFVFRGFDLVTFPAYPDCVPEFEYIAASSNAESLRKYKKACTTLRRNLPAITSCSALDVMQDQFNGNSDEYREIGERRGMLNAPDDKDLHIKVLEQKVEGLTGLLLDKCAELREARAGLGRAERGIEDSERAMSRMKSMGDDQCRAMQASIDHLNGECSDLKAKFRESEDGRRRLEGSCSKLKKRVESARSVESSLRSENRDLADENKRLKSEINSINGKNLVYRQKVDANSAVIADQGESIKNLESKLHETVMENKRLSRELSNRGGEIDGLKSAIRANEQLIFEYQQVYADQCAYAVGVNLDNVPVTASTTPKELRSFIYGKTSPYLQHGAASVHDASADTMVDGPQGDADGRDGLVVL